MNDSDLLKDAQDKYIVPGLERGLLLLCEFSRRNRTLTAPELARRLALPRSTIFRLLTTLETMGFVTRSGNEYRLGMSVLRLGFEYLASLELTELGQPLLARLCDRLNYPSNLVVRDGRSIVYVAKVSPPSVFSSAVNVGTRLPAHATVLGRILLEDLSLAELRELYPEDHLEQFSPCTPKTVMELFDMVQADRQRGFVSGEGFFESAISTVAAPVRDQIRADRRGAGRDHPDRADRPRQLQRIAPAGASQRRRTVAAARLQQRCWPRRPAPRDCPDEGLR